MCAQVSHLLNYNHSDKKMIPLRPFPYGKGTAIASGRARALICFSQHSKAATVLSGQHVKCGFAARVPVTRGSVAPNEHRGPFYNYNSYNRSRPEGDGQEANLDGRTDAKSEEGNKEYTIKNTKQPVLFANV